MTEGIINSDGSRNWQANILLDNVKRLEQENKELKEDVLKWQKEFSRQYQINENKGYSKAEENYRSALEEISGLASPHCTQCSQIIKIVNEVLK